MSDATSAPASAPTSATTSATTFAASFAELVEQPVSARLDVLASAVAVLLDQPPLPGGDVDPPPIRRDVRDRVVACGLLGGALGRSAVEALVRALDDRSPQVRAAAVAALGVTAAVKGHEHRLAFAVLHRRTDVRRATLLAPSLSPTLLGLLLADERVGEDAMASLSQRLASEPRLAHTVVDLHRGGHLGDVDAAQLLRRLPWHQPAAIFAALPHSPSTTRLGECDGDALAALLSTSTDDHLVDVVRVVFGTRDTFEGSSGVGDRATILAALHDAIADLFSVPAHVGCGHLRLTMLNGEDYGARPEMVQSLVRSFVRARWAGALDTELVVLPLGHEEGAVVNVRVKGGVHSFTPIPMISPRCAGSQMFVNHPEVTALLRRELAAFLTLCEDLTGVGASRSGALLEAMNELGDQQMGATLTRLAKGLPIYDMLFDPETGSAEVSAVGTV